MKKLILTLMLVASVAWAQQSTLTGPKPGSAAVVIPNSGGTTSTYTAGFLFNMGTPNPNVFRFPEIFTLQTNDNFVVQDVNGYNLFGIRADTYTTNSGALAWEFGSAQHNITDLKIWMSGSAGGDFGIIQNSVLKDGYQFQTGGSGHGLYLQVASPALTAIDSSITGTGPGTGNGYVTVLNSQYGTFYIPALVGNSLEASQTATIGAAAGTGGSVAVSVDSRASDVSVQITLVTGHTGTTTGTLFTYNLEAYDVALDNTFPVKAVFSAATDTAANEIAKVYVSSGTRSTFVFSARAALTIDTTYKWNFIIAR